MVMVKSFHLDFYEPCAKSFPVTVQTQEMGHVMLLALYVEHPSYFLTRDV
jgi:hypothetical protein